MNGRRINRGCPRTSARNIIITFGAANATSYSVANIGANEHNKPFGGVEVSSFCINNFVE